MNTPRHGIGWLVWAPVPIMSLDPSDKDKRRQRVHHHAAYMGYVTDQRGLKFVVRVAQDQTVLCAECELIWIAHAKPESAPSCLIPGAIVTLE